MSNDKSGKIAEFAARMFLRLKGYRVVAKNFKAGNNMNIGEVDFVAQKHNCLVFVEVKKRSCLEKAAYAVSRKQQLRIIRGAEFFLKTHKKYRFYDIRFDVVLIAFPLKIKHLKNAWSCESVN